MKLHRILRLCGGDMGFRIGIDFELFSTQRPLAEISSVSNFETFKQIV
jgi:seryl-tRNA synthetase